MTDDALDEKNAMKNEELDEFIELGPKNEKFDEDEPNKVKLVEEFAILVTEVTELLTEEVEKLAESEEGVEGGEEETEPREDEIDDAENESEVVLLKIVVLAEDALNDTEELVVHPHWNVSMPSVPITPQDCPLGQNPVQRGILTNPLQGSTERELALSEENVTLEVFDGVENESDELAGGAEKDDCELDVELEDEEDPGVAHPQVNSSIPSVATTPHVWPFGQVPEHSGLD